MSDMPAGTGPNENASGPGAAGRPEEPFTGARPAPLVVVLGASGLLGTAVTRELAARPVRMRAVSRRPTAVPPGGAAEVEVRTADLTTPGELAREVAGADAVVHLVVYNDGPGGWRSAERDEVAERVNVGLVRDLVDAIRAGRPSRPPVVIFAGSMHQAYQPLTGYNRQKLAAERLLEEATAAGLLRASTLRLSTLYGQGTDPGAHDHGVVAAMTRRALAGEPLTLWHGGAVRRDLLCVDDAARAFVSALNCADALAGRHWPVGTGNAIRIADLFQAVVEVVSTLTGRPPVPVTSVEPPAQSLATDQLNYLCDPSAFRAVTGWSARVSLPAALERLVTTLRAAR